MSSRASPPHFNPDTLSLMGEHAVGSGLLEYSDRLRRVVTLRDIGRTMSEQERYAEAHYAPVDEGIWLAETLEIQAHAARVAGLKDLADPFPPAETLPVLQKMDSEIAQLVMSKVENPLTKMPLEFLPESLRDAPLDPLAAEALVITSQMRLLLDHLETALVRRDHNHAEDIGLGMAMRVAGIVQLVKESEKSRDKLDESLQAREARFGCIACNRPAYYESRRRPL